LPISHDEVVHGKGSLIGKMPGDRWQQLANLRAYLGFMWAHPGKNLLFMGSEFAQSQEWNSEKSLEWWLLEYAEHSGTLAAVRDLNRIYQATPALWQLDDEPRGFNWIDANESEANIFTWLRWDEAGNCVAVIINMSPNPDQNYRISLPFIGEWVEILNTDSLAYGGSGMGNQGCIQALPLAWNGRPASADIVVPPLSAVYLSFDRTRN